MWMVVALLSFNSLNGFTTAIQWLEQRKNDWILWADFERNIWHEGVIATWTIDFVAFTNLLPFENLASVLFAQQSKKIEHLFINIFFIKTDKKSIKYIYMSPANLLTVFL